MRQSDKLDKTSFIVLVCDVDDLSEILRDKGIKKPVTIAKKLVNYQPFRERFTDLIMDDFWLCASAMLDDKDKYLEAMK